MEGDAHPKQCPCPSPSVQSVAESLKVVLKGHQLQGILRYLVGQLLVLFLHFNDSLKKLDDLGPLEDVLVLTLILPAGARDRGRREVPLHPFRRGRNRFGLSLLLGGERGKEALTVPPSGSPDSYDPKMLWRIVTNGGERGGIMVANYVAAFVPHGVSMLHSLFPWASEASGRRRGEQ